MCAPVWVGNEAKNGAFRSAFEKKLKRSAKGILDTVTTSTK
jgi:hypothetical protein